MSKIEKRIIWLASYPKSGNTWFRIFLIHLLSDSETSVSINDLRQIPISSSRNIFDEYSGLHSSDLTNEEIQSLLPEVFKRISQECNEILFFKTHDAWILDKEKKSIFPEEVTRGVIYIIRNPLDIAVSYSYHNGNNIDKTINDMNRKAYSVCSDERELKIQLPQIMGSWSEHVDSWIRGSNLPVHIMRYEDMIYNTNKSFTEALKFLDMNFSREEIENAIEKSSFQHLQELESKQGFKERSIHSDSFFRKGQIDDWKNVLTHSQVEKIVNQHSELMHKFGYLN